MALRLRRRLAPTTSCRLCLSITAPVTVTITRFLQRLPDQRVRPTRATENESKDDLLNMSEGRCRG